MVYVGMDVHRKRTQVAIMEEDGTEILNRNVSNDPAELSPLLGTLEPGTPVVFEAAYGWGWLAELLDDWDLEPHLAHAKNCKAIASARLKNDKVDAGTLAHLLRTDLLPEAWIAPREVRDLRWLLRHRASLVRSGTALKNRIHGVLADSGIHCPIDDLWTKAGRTWLSTLELPPIHQEIVNDCLALIDALAVPVRRLDREIRELAKPDPRVEALQRVPGIGRLTAMTLVAEIGDIGRFPTARKLSAWAGLTPTVRNSDRKVRHGHISKQGSKWVRFVLGEAAHVANRYPPFARPYADIASRRGKKIATVAVARKLLARCFHVLKEVSQDSQSSEKAFGAGCARESNCA
jgi:transposase